jgi:glycosyltransferase involved in cell wall biosynthesis/SAM-dependent methyltransferase
MPWLAPRYGGPATLVPQLSSRLEARGHEVEIVTTNVDGAGALDIPTGRLTEWAGAAVTFHPIFPPRKYLTSSSMLADLRIRLSTFDVIHIHCLYRFHDVAAAAVTRLEKTPYILQAHGSLDPWHRRQRRRAKDVYHAVIEDPIIRGASAVLCTSRREQQSIRELGYTVPTWVVPIGIDADELRLPGIPDFRVANGMNADTVVITFLGRITEKKGVPLLLDSFRRTAASFPSAQLVIAGPDDEGIGRDLIPIITDAGLADRVSLPGVLDGPAKRTLLQRSSVFVLPSADESFGIAVAEAMAVGCPVVVSPEVAIEDLVRSSGAGLVVDRNASAIANAMEEILSDPRRSAAMGEAGRRAVDEQLSWPIAAARTEALYEAVLIGHRGSAARTRSIEAPAPAADSWTGAAIACPQCRALLEPRMPGASWACAECGLTGRVEGDVPILLLRPELAEHDELDHDHQPQKVAQAAHFDRPGQETFEVDRPHGTPRLYRFFLGEKFRRAVGPIRPHLVGATGLIVCGGSGMDAELLARLGARVTSSDLSLGAATRAGIRSQRYGVATPSIVADVEHLPYRDQSVDIVAVHDGLHHLDDPFVGLSEMARVARRWVVVTEPARASITRLATRLGLALETEAAGNQVARMAPREVAAFLRARGYVVLRAERYAMYYPHHPGPMFRFLSRPLIFPVVRTCWRLANALIGRFGNKMVVLAERNQSVVTDSMPT